MGQPDFPVWPFRPNWSGNVTETLSWLTDVLTSQTGSEQRRSLREFPRKEIEYTTLLTGRERATHDNVLSRLGQTDFMLPLWYDQHVLGQAVGGGDDLLMIDTARLGEFVVGGYLLISFDRPKFEYEVAQIATLNAGSIVLVDPLTRGWAAGSRVYPLQRARHTDPPQLARQSDATVTGSYRFRTAEVDPWQALADDVGSTALITGGLVSRQLTPTPDGTVYDPDAGITVGQAAMARALFEASFLLTSDPATDAREAGVYYRGMAFAVLDAFLGFQHRRGAILRQRVDADTPIIPHWLYAARGDVPGLASIGEAYELVPIPGAPAPGFASADPAAFRDLEWALTYAVEYDAREGMSDTWDALREGLRKANLLGRQLTDGREIIEPLPGLEVAPASGHPTGMRVFSQVITTGSQQFYYRDLNGDIVVNIPDSLEPFLINNDEIELPQVRISEVTRSISEYWRTATSYQTPDQYLMVQFLVDRNMDPSLSEKITIGFTVDIGGSTDAYNADFTASDISTPDSSGVKTWLVAREQFVNSSGQPLPLGAHIVTFRIQILGVLAYSLRLRAARILSGPSPEAVAANVNAYARGDAIPFLPGVAPYRISGYGAVGAFQGFAGDPAAQAQMVDGWVDLVGRTSDLLPNVTAATLPVVDPATGAVVYPITPTTSNGLTKSNEVLLVEQALRFLGAAQDAYAAAAGVEGPLAHTFTLNRPDRVYNGNHQPHTWVFNNIALETDIVFQLRAIEGVSRIVSSTYTPSKFLMYDGKYITHDGKFVIGSLNRRESPLGFGVARGWVDNVSRAREIVDTFVTWFMEQIAFTADLVHNGVQITHEGSNLVTYVTGENATLARHILEINDPTDGYNRRGVNPGAVAVMLKIGLNILRQDPTSTFYSTVVSDMWRFLLRRYNTTGDMEFMWTNSTGVEYWYYSEIISALTVAILNEDTLPPGVDPEIMRRMLIDTRQWLERKGAAAPRGNFVANMGDVYKNYQVLLTEPNAARPMSIDFLRMTEDFDNDVSVPIRSEYDPSPFHRPQYAWWVKGREQDRQFRRMLYTLRGRAVPFWMPTFMRDFELVEDGIALSRKLVVENVGYTEAGGPRRTREHILIALYDGSYLMRQIVSSQAINNDIEELTLDLPLYERLYADQVKRISFIDLMRLDQDSVQYTHDADANGVAQATTVFRSVKDTRVPNGA